MNAPASTRRFETESPSPQSIHDGAQRTGLNGAFRETRVGWLVLAVVWVAAALYTGFHLNQGWLGIDAGIVGQMARRALHGQVPHRDFIDIYTGGLTYLNAFAFRLFGVNFLSLRIPLFLFFLAWVPSVYWIARRFLTPIAAGAITLLAVAWSLPNYPEAMSSWYNLFFTTWGVLALFRYTETERRRWLWIAGLCGGLSFLCKVTGLYFVAAALLFFVFREIPLPGESSSAKDRSSLLYRLFATAGLLLFLAAVIGEIAHRPDVAEFSTFVFPVACLVAYLTWEIWRTPSKANAARFRRLFSPALPFLGGVLAPAAALMLWYGSQGAFARWVEDVFVRSMLRTQWTAFDPISPVGIFGLLPLLLIAGMACDPNHSSVRLVRYGSPLLLAGLLLAAWKWEKIYYLVGFSIPLLIPLIALAAPFVLRHRSLLPRRTRAKMFLLVATTVVWALVQFPRSTIGDFWYVAPFAALSLAALFSTRKRVDRLALAWLLAFGLALALWLHPLGYTVLRLGSWGEPLHLRPIALKRAGGVQVPAEVAAQYEELVRLIRQHSRSRYIYCGPDCPQVYFLSGFHNPTICDIDPFLRPDFFNPLERERHVLEALEDHHVNVIVLRVERPFDSGPLPPGLLALLEQRFPHSDRVRHYEVRWK